MHSQSTLIKKNTRLYSHSEVYIGHTATNSWKCKSHYPEADNVLQETLNGPITIPMHRCNIFNMDTGAGFRGKLSIMDINTKEFWQSDFTNELYKKYI